jgi:hypothetical protein
VFLSFCLQCAVLSFWALSATYSTHGSIYWRLLGSERFDEGEVSADKVSLFILGFSSIMCMVHIIYILWSFVVGPILSLFDRFNYYDASLVLHSSQGRLLAYTTCASSALCVCFITLCTVKSKWPSYLPDTWTFS